MADNKRDVELIIRARDLSTKPFQDVAKAVEGVTAAIDDQVASAKKGEISAGELRDTMRSLEQAGAALIKQQALVDLYERIAAQLGAAETKAKDAKAAQAALAAEQTNAEAVTKRQEAALTALGRASDGAQRKVETLQASLAVQGAKLQQAGIDTNNLARAQDQIRVVAQGVGQALVKVDGTLSTYNATLRETKAAQAAANTEAKAAADLGAFRQIGDDAVSSVARLDSLAGAEVQTAAQTSSLARALGALLNPSQEAVSTLGGLEGKVTEVAAEIGDGSKSIYSYTNAINELSRAQAAILSQARDVDAYKTQQAAVASASATYDTARAKVLSLADAIRTAGEPSTVLAADLSTARQEMVAASAALDTQKVKLDKVSSSLERAGIDTRDLTAAEQRLTAVGNTAAAAQAKIASAQAGTNNKAGLFLGLKPYELQNLSYQLNDVFTQLASGTKPMQVFAQQGGQISQIFPGMFTTIIRFIPALAAAGAALFTVFEVFKRSTEVAELTRKFNAELSATADIGSYTAKNLAQVTQAVSDYGVSIADATAATRAFVKDSIDPSLLVDFGKSAKDMADVVGVKVPDAAGQMAAAFSGGYDQVKKLDDEFDFLTAAERVQIKAMFDSGQTAEARTAAFRIFQKEMNTGAEAMRGPLTDALRHLEGAWKNFLDFLGGSSIVRDTIEDFKVLAQLLDKITAKLPGANGANAAGTASARAAGGGGLPGGVSRRGVGLLGTVAGALMPGTEPLISAVSGAGKVNITADIDAIVRTVIGEARAGDLQGYQDVAAVILNRMDRSGQSASQVVHAKGQFESMDNPSTAKHLADIDQNSAEYLKALNAILPILEGKVVDPVKGAVNFVSPGGQAAKGRKMPAFAQPGLMTANRGGQQFFGGTFPGDRSSGAPTQSQDKAGQDYVTELREQQTATEKVSDAERVRLAGLKALREAQSRNADPASQKEAQQIAEQTEQWKVSQERAQQAVQLAQQLASAATSAASGQDQSLQQRLDAIGDRFKVIYDRIAEAKAKGLTEVDGKSLDELTQQIQANESILKQQETMKFYESQLADLERQRSEQIKAINAQVAAGTLSPQDAVKQISEVNSGLLPSMKKVADQAVAFATALRTAKPDPKLEAFIAQMQSAGAQAVGSAATDSLKIFEDATKGLQDQLTTELNAINDLAAQGTITSTDAFTRAQAAVSKLSPQIAAMAQDAVTFAQGLNTATPDPKLQAFIEQMQALQARSSNTASTKSPANVVGNQQIQEDERKLNEILSQRNDITQNYQTLVQQGQMTQAQADQKTAAAYAEFKPLIASQIGSIQSLIKVMHDSGTISDQLFESWNAKLAGIATQSTYVSQNFIQLRDTIQNSFVQGVVDAFNTVAQAVGAAIAGTGSWKDALASLGQAALQFASSFLKSIADILIQMLALKAIQSLPFFNSLTSGLLNVTGLGAGAVALGAAGAAVTAGATATTASAAALGAAGGVVGGAAAAMIAAAAALQAAATTELVAKSVPLLHTGGTVGFGPSKMSRSGINPAIFAGAPRYHRGRVGVGLRHNEVAAVLKKGEEVLASDDPRNIMNRNKGGGGGGSGGPAFAQRIIATFNPDEVTSLMASSKGEQTTLAVIKKNAPTIRQLISGGK